MTDDPLWPRAAAWLSTEAGPADVAIVGVPTHLTSISPTGAQATPVAIRAALSRYSTYSWSHDIDLASIVARDGGDVLSPDGEEGIARVIERTSELAAQSRLLIALGGIVCGDCHTIPPTSGMHPQHQQGEVDDDYTDCANCHTNTDANWTTYSGAHNDGSASMLAARHWTGRLTRVLPGGARRIPERVGGPEGGIAVRWTSNPVSGCMWKSRRHSMSSSEIACACLSISTSKKYSS